MGMPIAEHNKKLFKSDRPETAPMFTRSHKIIVPQSGRPRASSKAE